MSIKKGTVVPFFNIPKKQKNLSLDPSASSGQVPRGKSAKHSGEFDLNTRLPSLVKEGKEYEVLRGV